MSQIAPFAPTCVCECVLNDVSNIYLFIEIPDFLTNDECDHMIKRAADPKEGGMFESMAKGGLTPIDTYQPTGSRYIVL